MIWRAGTGGWFHGIVPSGDAWLMGGDGDLRDARPGIPRTLGRPVNPRWGRFEGAPDVRGRRRQVPKVNPARPLTLRAPVAH